MLFKEIIFDYSEKYTKRTNTLCVKNTELLRVTVGGAFIYRWFFKGIYWGKHDTSQPG
jgi:hypothetical protein